jgi:hypothetical protein
MTTRYIDMTPTWEGLLPYLLTILSDGSFEGQKIARDELTRMAKLADMYVAENKK